MTAPPTPPRMNMREYMAAGIAKHENVARLHEPRANVLQKRIIYDAPARMSRRQATKRTQEIIETKGRDGAIEQRGRPTRRMIIEKYKIRNEPSTSLKGKECNF